MQIRSLSLFAGVVLLSTACAGAPKMEDETSTATAVAEDSATLATAVISNSNSGTNSRSVSETLEGEMLADAEGDAGDKLVYDHESRLDEHPCLDLSPDEIVMVDATRRRMHQTLCGASLWLDGLFGEQRNLEAARGVRGRLETSYTYSEFYGQKFRPRLDVRVRLPNLENGISAFFGRDNEDDFVRDRQEGFALRSQFPSIDDRDEWLGGLGYALPANDKFSADFRVGVRNLRMPRAFVRNRIRYNAYADKRNLVHLRLTPFWNTRDDFGITPGIDLSRVLSPTRLLRLSNVGTVSERSRGLDWRSALIHYMGLRNGRGIAVEAFVRGLTSGQVPIREYGSRVVYRHPLLSDRLFAELVVGYSFPKELPGTKRDGSTLAAVGLEMPFGHPAQQIGKLSAGDDVAVQAESELGAPEIRESFQSQTADAPTDQAEDQVLP